MRKPLTEKELYHYLKIKEIVKARIARVSKLLRSK